MALKTYNPTSPGKRGMARATFEEVAKVEPTKPLLVTVPKRAGRNNRGRICVRHRGGGATSRVRMIDFKRDKIGVEGRVITTEYDPNRSAYIALVHYVDGDKRYILAPDGLKVGDSIKAGEDAEIKPGNALPIRLIPTGTMIHNIELYPGRGGQLVRGAGAAAQLMGKEDKYCLVRLPSGELRRVLSACFATMGQVGNLEYQNIKSGKAGRSRWLGWRPAVRGSAMNPRDHPHGGGEGRSPRGMAPKTPWGKPALGYKTRTRNKISNKFIVKRRK